MAFLFATRRPDAAPSPPATVRPWFRSCVALLGMVTLAAAACDTTPPVEAPQPARTTSVKLPDRPASAGAPTEPVKFTLDPNAMQREEGYAWIVHLPPELHEDSDNLEATERSPFRLLENGRPLGPAHAPHAAIREGGRGAYSHWVSKIYFSTSDNTDPRQNGRAYELAIGEEIGLGD